ncbi:MAG: L-iditol 2-dehydrogenase [Chloroflexota bacterium]|jgi:L-iditol 2-dehydrogenase|nr:L-iditol 2-dehydrogenase [Chloroflexota bacterium]
MLALRKLVAGPGDPALVEVPIPIPGPGEARIAVTATGICGTDLHLLRDEYSFRPPVTMGHEVAGRVDLVGEGVDPTWIGALVAPETAFSTCGVCRWCRDGRPMLCAMRRSIGSGVDGGFAAFVVVPARNLHRIPDSIGDHAAALAEPLACVCNAIGEGVIAPGDRVVVTGAGAMGILAAQVARAAGGLVTVVGTPADHERLRLIASLGMSISSTDDPDDVARLQAAGEGRQVDVVVECAGVEAAVRNGLRLVRPDGSFVQVGLLAGDVTIPFGEVVLKEIHVIATFGSSPAAWLRMERLLGAGLIELAPLVSDVLPLSDWRRAFDQVEKREGIKTIFDPRLRADGA